MKGRPTYLPIRMDNVETHLAIHCQHRFLASDFLSIGIDKSMFRNKALNLLWKFTLASSHIFFVNRIYFKLLGHGLRALGRQWQDHEARRQSIESINSWVRRSISALQG